MGISRAIAIIAGLLKEQCVSRKAYERPQTGTEPSNENDGYNTLVFCVGAPVHGSTDPSFWR